ncbi:hypothetical protein PNOK_0805900 [Pyrrhoderma noxium]|uniref:Uncharacterized protein n=1 Tax=Pyrrhoderma noxium TaxID=2282107 RepID=A0A286UA49_9AGAM|nr:hypothetical protein PNOK_0805900 [Pyrrhoderma noxium]
MKHHRQGTNQGTQKCQQKFVPQETGYSRGFHRREGSRSRRVTDLENSYGKALEAFLSWYFTSGPEVRFRGSLWNIISNMDMRIFC